MSPGDAKGVPVSLKQPRLALHQPWGCRFIQFQAGEISTLISCPSPPSPGRPFSPGDPHFLILVVGPCLLPLESHQLSPAFNFLVSGCWGKTRTHRVQRSNPLLTMFCICKSYFRTSFLRLI